MMIGEGQMNIRVIRIVCKTQSATISIDLKENFFTFFEEGPHNYS